MSVPGAMLPTGKGCTRATGRQLRSCFTRARRAQLARSVDLARGLDVLTAVLSSHQYNAYFDAVVTIGLPHDLFRPTVRTEGFEDRLLDLPAKKF